MLSQFYQLGVDIGIRILTPQFLQCTVNTGDGLGTVYRGCLQDNLGTRNGHNAGHKSISYHGRITHDSVGMRQYIGYHAVAEFDLNSLRHCPLSIIFGGDPVDLTLFKIQLVGIFQKDCHIPGIQPSGRHLTLGQVVQRIGGDQVQAALVFFKQNQIIKRRNHLVLKTHVSQFIDPVVKDLYTCFELVLREHAAFIRGFQLVKTAVFSFHVIIIQDGAVNLDDIGVFAFLHAAEDLADTVLNGIISSVFGEKAELQRIDLNDTSVILPVIFDKTILDIREGGKIFHELSAAAGILLRFLPLFFLQR